MKSEKEWRFTFFLTSITFLLFFANIKYYYLLLTYLFLVFLVPAVLIQVCKAVYYSIKEKQLNKIHSLLTFCLILLASILYFYEEGYFWGQQVLKAEFIDERSRIDLILWENGKFKALDGWLFGIDAHKGNYNFINGTIKFDRFPIERDFIPKELKLTDDKIYFSSRDSSFYFFQITKNYLNP
jgi:hypothetical protein